MHNTHWVYFKNKVKCHCSCGWHSSTFRNDPQGHNDLRSEIGRHHKRG